MIAVGIDPGLSGALSFIKPNGDVAIEDIPTLIVPGTGLVRQRVDGHTLATLVRRHCPVGEAVKVFCEAVMTMGGQNNSVQSQGSLLRTLGSIEAVFDMLRWPCAMVSPQAWQGFYGLQGKKVEIRAKGAAPAAIEAAIRLYPGIADMLSRVRDHNRAESLLIAHYGLRKLS